MRAGVGSFGAQSDSRACEECSQGYSKGGGLNEVEWGEGRFIG